MFFTNSIFLIGLLFAVIPLIIHLIFKKRSKTIYFSAVIFIKNILKKEAKKFKFQEILLLLLRILIIVFLVLSIAKPVVYKKGANINFAKRKSIVFVIDNSLSMSAVSKSSSLLNRAKKICYNILKHSNDRDNYSIVLTSGLHKVFLSELISDKNIIEEKINEIKTSYLPNDIFNALRKADELIDKSHNKKKVICLVSDFQKINFINENNDIVNKYLKIKHPVLLFSVSDKSIKNSVIIETELPKVLKFKTDLFSLKSKIKNFSAEKNNLIVKLFIGNNAFNQKSVEVNPGEVKFVSFDNKINKTGMLYGYTEISDGDYLIEDNKDFFVFKIPDKINVAEYEDGNNLFYVLSALSPLNLLKNNSESDIRFTVLKKLKYVDSDLLILGKDTYTKNDFLTLKQYILNNKSIIIILGKKLNYNSFNNNILKKGIINGSIIGSENDVKGVTLEQIDFNHPVFDIFENLKALRNVKVNSFFKIIVNNDDINKKVIARFSNGYPAIIEYTPVLDTGMHVDSKIILFLFPPYKDETDIIYNPNFPPLIHQIVKYVLTTSQIYLLNNFKCGITVDDMENILDIDENSKIKCLTGNINDKIKSGVIIKPGVYEMGNYKFAVNNYFSESDIRVIDINKLKELYKGIKFFNVGTAGEHFSYNSDLNIIGLWKVFLLIAFILLIAEFVLSNYETVKRFVTGILQR